MKKRGFLILGIFLTIFTILLVLAAEGYLTGTTGYWTDKDETILGSEIIVLDSSQLEGAFGTPRLNLSFCEDGINICSEGQPITLTENMFKTYVTGISEICPDSGSGPQIYFEVYEKDDSAGDIGEDGTDDPIRVGSSKLNGIIRTVAPNCLSSVAIAPWAISLNDITNAEKETVGEDPNLTKKGIKQANALAKRLKKEKFDNFYCSNLKRSKQTAEIVSQKIKMKPKIEKSLNEFKADTLKEDRRKWIKKEEKHYNDLIKFLKKITKNPKKEKSILIIAHGLTNKVMINYFMELKTKKIIQFTQKETAVNVISWTDYFKNWRFDSWNNYSHLPKKLRGSIE